MTAELFSLLAQQSLHCVATFLFPSIMADELTPADDPNYKVAAKVDIQDLMAQDAEDESLRKYKEALLGDLSGDIARTLLLTSPLLC